MYIENNINLLSVAITNGFFLNKWNDMLWPVDKTTYGFDTMSILIS